MKTLKNVDTLYNDYEEGSLIVLDGEVSLDSLKSIIADAADDIRDFIQKSQTPGSRSKMVVDSKKYGHGVAEEDSEGYSRQLVPPEYQGTRADTNAPTKEGAWSEQRQKLKERGERGETPEKGWKKKSIPADDAVGIIETILSIKSMLKSYNPSDARVDQQTLEADKEEDLQKAREEEEKK